MSGIFFTAFSNRTDAVALGHEAVERLAGEGIEATLFLLDVDTNPAMSPDSLVVSLGGDGTFLKTARLVHHYGARVLAVNLGRLGFLLNVPSDELLDSVRDAYSHNQAVDRLALQITLSNVELEEFSFNEVVVERAQPGQMVRVKTFVNGDQYLTYSADGVMVATPTGSTGYNFSAGGPVIEATLGVMAMTPIAPHFTIDRSIIVDGSKVIRIEADRKPALVVADGRPIGALEDGDFVEVRCSPRPVRVVSSHDVEFGFRLRESLREGHA